jgi:molecular chaperone DnaK (HSP70)
MATISIDFGNSNTVVSILEAHTQVPQTLCLAELSRLISTKDREQNPIGIIPSLVAIAPEGEILTGEKVKAQYLDILKPQICFKNFKRDLVADFQLPPRQINKQFYNSQSIAELFIISIYQQLQRQQISIDNLIFTVPIGSFEKYLHWLKNLAIQLGVETVQFIDEATAASLGYAIKNPGSIVLAIDFGAGTLDLSLVRINSQLDGQRTAEVIAKSDVYIGGEDIDTWLVEDYLNKINSSRQQVGEIAWQYLLLLAEKLKISLSEGLVAREIWFDENLSIAYEWELTREVLEEILETRQLLEHLRYALDEILGLATSKGINKSDLDRVLLVGGTCLIPAIKNLIVAYFGKQKVNFEKPFEAVSHGALLFEQIEGIQDYLQYTYAIRLWQPQIKDYSFFNIFTKGTKYPCQREENIILQVAVEGQTEIHLDFGQLGEAIRTEVSFDDLGRMTSDFTWKQLGYKTLDPTQQQINIIYLDPPGKVGIDRIEIEFAIDENRILLATIVDLLSRKTLIARAAIAQLL